MKELYFEKLADLEFELFVAKKMKYSCIAKRIEKEIIKLEKKIRDGE